MSKYSENFTVLLDIPASKQPPMGAAQHAILAPMWQRSPNESVYGMFKGVFMPQVEWSLETSRGLLCMIADGCCLLSQESFEAAARPPIHQTDPSLTPVEVLPGESTHWQSLSMCLWLSYCHAI